MEEDKNEIVEEIAETKAVREEKFELENVEAEKVEPGVTSTTGQGKGLSIASMVLGICSIVFYSSFWIAVSCGVLAVIFGIKGKKGEGKKMAKSGFITGIIGLSLQTVLFVIGLIIGIAAVGALGSMI